MVYTIKMEYEWDNDKNTRNVLERGLDFALVDEFVWGDAVIIEDARHDYGEKRFRAFGRIQEKLYVVVYTERIDSLRIISLRRANKREESLYEKTRKT